MQRRTIVKALVGASLLAPAVTQPALAQSVAQNELSGYYLSMLISIGMGMRDSTLRSGLQRMEAIRQTNPDWGTWGASCDVTHLLFALASSSDQGTLLRVSELVVDCWGGIDRMSPGKPTDPFRTLCAAATITLQNPATFSRMSTSRGATAVLLLCFSGVATGPERNAWAQLGLRETRQYGQATLREWTQDNLTGRWIAVGTAVAGDYASAAAQYESVLANSTGAMENVVAGHLPATSIGRIVVNGLSDLWTRLTGGNHVLGLAATMAGLAILKAEGATIFFLGGQQDRGVELLELSRAGAISDHANAPSAPLQTAIACEDQLTRRGAVLVQVATTQVGCLAVVSTRRQGRLQRTLSIDCDAGGVLLAETMGGWSEGFTRHPGLVQKFDQANRSPARRAQQDMINYVTEATTFAELIAGRAIRQALSNAHVTAQEEVIVIVPPALASLPLGLSRTGQAPSLAEAYQLRFATTLASALACEQERRRHPETGASVAFLGANANMQLPYAAFESAAVVGSFPSTQRRTPPPSSDGHAVLASLQGADHWHIASHGVWDFRHQENSGLLLGGNRPITVSDIMSFHPNPAPRLVYLSACETDLINVDRDLNNFVGLNTAFLASGAACVIGTQWTVSDVAAALLAAKFYAIHIGEGASPATALKTAQTWLRAATPEQLSAFVTALVRSGHVNDADSEAIAGYLLDLPADQAPFQHPYFWGGYQVYGA